MDRKQEIQRLRDLAKRTAEFAASDCNQERKRLWISGKDLHQIRPVVQIELGPVEGVIPPDRLLCEDPFFREIEYRLLHNLFHAEELGDDYVLEDCYTVGLEVESTSYGVEIQEIHSQEKDSIAFTYNHPIDDPEKIDLLVPRKHILHPERSMEKVNRIADIFGDLLPVKMFESIYVPALTSELYQFIGNDNMMFWTYDEPEALHRLMRYLTDDRMRLFEEMEKQGLVFNNTKGSFVGSGTPGYISGGPEGDRASLKDIWVWLESQETTMFSPESFKEFFLPYIAEFGKKFKYVYYGCCEQLDNKWEDIYEAIPNIRTVSVSPWSDIDKMAEMVQDRVVLCKKPTPQLISGNLAEWDSVEKELDRTFAAARRNNSNLEIIFRDLYTVSGDIQKLKTWVQKVRERM